MPKEKIFTESVILNSAHSMIMSHKPEGIALEQINNKLQTEPQEVSNLGLFDRATPNYTTFYPDVTEDDLNPKDSEFIEPVFRMLSNVTVHARWNPIYFPSDVLKKAMYKMVGQTVNIDHEMAIGNAIGTVKSVEWQNAYTANGVKVPAGFNAVLKIDGKSNPRIARGIMMDPPSIHANSVTVNFSWQKSHPKMDDQEFFSKLGTFDEKGKLVQKVATEIEAFHETSLVSHGADPFAQKVDDKGKIVKPNYAADRYPLSENVLNYANWDWKDLQAGDFDEVILNTGTGVPASYKLTYYKNSENMEELLTFLDKLFGFEEGTLTEENYQEKLGEIDFAALKAKAEKADAPVKVLDLEGEEAIENELTELREFKEKVPENLETQIALAEVGQTAIDTLRVETKRLYGLTAGDEQDAQILALIEGADYKTLNSLHKQYNDSAEEKFEMRCNDCNSTNVTRASANPAEEGDDKKIKSNAEVLSKFTGLSAGKVYPWMVSPKKEDK